ncbi:MAG: hypothetical protein JO295_01260 [Verrucomicrobia bacterium]|nr:hypothetical protein [Verrucomicrobiota bacterium]
MSHLPLSDTWILPRSFAGLLGSRRAKLVARGMALAPVVNETDAPVAASARTDNNSATSSLWRQSLAAIEAERRPRGLVRACYVIFGALIAGSLAFAGWEVLQLAAPDSGFQAAVSALLR